MEKDPGQALVKAFIKGIALTPQNHTGSSIYLAEVIIHFFPEVRFTDIREIYYPDRNFQRIAKAINALHIRYGINHRVFGSDRTPDIFPISKDQVKTIARGAYNTTVARVNNYIGLILEKPDNQPVSQFVHSSIVESVLAQIAQNPTQQEALVRLAAQYSAILKTSEFRSLAYNYRQVKLPRAYADKRSGYLADRIDQADQAFESFCMRWATLFDDKITEIYRATYLNPN